MAKNKLTSSRDTGYREHLTQARSSGGEHHLDTVGVRGSNPRVPTTFLSGVDMPEITVIVDGKARTTEASVVRELIKDKRVIAARVDGVLVDLATPLAGGQAIETVLADSPEGVVLMRHSTAHVMAEAV